MKLTVWGSRGSLASAGPETIRYGGNTACVQVEGLDGSVVVLDAGTGTRSRPHPSRSRPLGRADRRAGRERRSNAAHRHSPWREREHGSRGLGSLSIGGARPATDPRTLEKVEPLLGPIQHHPETVTKRPASKIQSDGRRLEERDESTLGEYAHAIDRPDLDVGRRWRPGREVRGDVPGHGSATATGKVVDYDRTAVGEAP